MTYRVGCLSICPGCHNILEGFLLESENKIFLEKECDSCGRFEDLIWSDANHYIGFKNCEKIDANRCHLNECICDMHQSDCILLFLEITNRCNFDCRVCFTDANTRDIELTRLDMEKILKVFTTKGEGLPHLLLGGGEPTVREDLPEIIKTAREMGYHHILLGTNGKRIADEEGYLEELVGSGLGTVYLQFDGLDNNVYRHLRNEDALQMKMRVIERVRECNDINVILVPTIVKGVNLEQVSRIFDFAVKNRDVVRAISFQPVTFTGRIDRSDRRERRVTPYDIMKELERGSVVGVDDFIPNHKLLKIFQMLQSLSDNNPLVYNQAVECGSSAIYLFRDGKPSPVQDHFNVEKLFELTRDRVGTMDGNEGDLWKRIKLSGGLSSYILKETIRNPRNLGLLKTLVTRKNVKDKFQTLDYPLIVTILHIQDDYNFQIERTQSCPLWTGMVVKGEVKLYPYCQFNLISRGDMNKTGKL